MVIIDRNVTLSESIYKHFPYYVCNILPIHVEKPITVKGNVFLIGYHNMVNVE